MTSKTGKITSWKDEKGFGFITPDSGGKSVFFHINEYSSRHKRPVRDLSVNYRLSTDSRGRTCATRVSPAKGHGEASRAERQKSRSIVLSGVFFCAVGGLVVFEMLPIFILGVYLVFSALTFVLYAMDKSAARSGKWRTSESTLHLFSLIGGWPGAAIAQSRLRHKSKKLSFRVVYWFTVIINCIMVGWLLTPEGAYRLNIMLRMLNVG